LKRAHVLEIDAITRCGVYKDVIWAHPVLNKVSKHEKRSILTRDEGFPIPAMFDASNLIHDHFIDISISTRSILSHLFIETIQTIEIIKKLFINITYLS